MREALNMPDYQVDCHVGKRLKEFRKMKDMSQTALADAVSITFQQVQKYERGANRISASRLYHMAIILDVTPSQFFEGLPGCSAPRGLLPDQKELLAQYDAAPRKIRQKFLQLLKVLTQF